jgi:DNA primase
LAVIPEEIITRIKESVDIVDVIGRHVTLKRSGRSYKGLCPFHDEKTPSFHVFPESGNFKCFGCDKGGDVFAFLMQRNGTTFRETVEDLAREAGIALPEPDLAPDDAERFRRRDRAREALAVAARFYRELLGRPVGSEARDYLVSRFFNDATLESYGIGFSPDSFDGFHTWALGKGISEEALFDAGLVKRNTQGKLYDTFRCRIMFPIHDRRGQVIGFGARAMGDAQPKYLNSPDGILFHKGRELYGLHLALEPARKEGRLLLVEGYTDVMHCHQAGIKEVAAALGTSLTVENARLLRKSRVPVFLLYDGDEAGRRAAERAADILLAERVDASVALLPPGQDPADLVARDGREGLEAVLERSEDLWGYRMERTFQRHDTDRIEDREAAVRELGEVIQRMAHPIRRDLAFKLLSERTGVPESTLRNQIRPEEAFSVRTQPAAPTELSVAYVRMERDFAGAALLESGIWERIEQLYPAEGFKVPALREIAVTIRDLRGLGESLTREALLGRLADRDEAVQMVQALPSDDDVLKRVDEDLRHIAKRQRLDAALRTNRIQDVLDARRGKPEESRDDPEDDSFENGAPRTT